MNDLCFRRIDPADLTELIEVRGATRENAFSREDLRKIGITEESTTGRLKTTHRGWLCEAEGRIVGFAMGDGSTGELWVLAILPDFEGRGIGTRLLTRVEEWLWSLGWDHLWLWTGADPKLRAFGFYKSRDWHEAERKGPAMVFRKTRPER
jgi:GNAT superfamily N-acetyltransferase